jgi:hypothetical protein
MYKFQTAEYCQQAMNDPSATELTRGLRFLEASSSLIHDMISNLHRHFHPDDNFPMIHRWRLVHQCYWYGANYKNREASTPEYWAETLIFGGPALFRRGQDQQQVCMNGPLRFLEALTGIPA